jgi:6-pyruvoyltetrahydropterin/6-carboxytetrahydropterin synthase
MNITASRYHDFSAGHRVVGHENRCAWLHGHNYRIHFTCQARDAAATPLDGIGRVIDFSVIKSTLCEWLEKTWDHKFLAWEKDEAIRTVLRQAWGADALLGNSIVWVSFNPTAENMARYLVEVTGPLLLPPHIKLVEVVVEETRKCSATVSRRDL